MKNFWKEYRISQALLSLLAAVCIWAFAISQADVTKEMNFGMIPVTFTGTESLAENDLVVISGQDTAFRVYVQGKITLFDNFLKSGKSISVEVDLSDYQEPGTYQIAANQINVLIPGEGSKSDGLKLSDKGFTPRTFEIVIDHMQTRMFPITANVSGNPADGYRYQEPELSRTSVMVTGPESILDQISSVVVNVEANALSESMIYTAPLVFLDAEQNVIQSEFLSPEIEVIEVTVRTNKESELPLKVDLIPSNALGAEDVTVNINPKSIPVFADEAVLKNYPALTLGQIDLSTLNLSGVYTFPIKVPSRLQTIGTVPEYAEVTVEVKDQMTRQFTITDFDLTDVARDPHDIEVQTESVTVSVTGARAFMESLTAEDITVSLSYDSSALGVGEHDLQAQVTVGRTGNYELSSDTVSLRISLTEPERADTPEEELT